MPSNSTTPGWFELESWGQLAELAGSWLSAHTFIAILLVAGPLAIVVLVFNFRRESTETVGRTLKVLMSAGSTVVALTPLLPLVARASRGATGALPPVPHCVDSLLTSPCKESVDTYSSLFLREAVPYSTLLAVAVLCFFFAALVWCVTAVRDAFKPEQAGSKSGGT